RQPQRPPHQARLNHVAEQGIHQYINTGGQHGHQRPQLNQRHQYRRYGRNNGTDVGNVIQQKSDQPPQRPVIHPQQRQQQSHHAAGTQTDQGFDKQILLHRFAEAGEMRKGLGFFSEGPFHFGRKTRGFEQNKNNGKQNQEGIGQHPAQS